MKDLPLSLLSRGCGQFVPLEGRQNGRLDVCFTPEDYYIWRSQDTLLRLSTSGCVLTRQESALPKTYSTRRGALLLYSQGLVTLKTLPSEANDGKQHFVQCTSAQPVQQGAQQQSILKELTLSIVNFSSGLGRSHRLPTATLPLPPLQPPNDKHSGLLLSHQPTSEQHVRLKRVSLERISEQQESQHEEGSKTKLDVFLQMLTISTNSSPHTEHHSWDNLEALTSEVQENVLETDLLRATEDLQRSDVNSICDNQNQLCDDKASSKQPNTNRHSGQMVGSELKSYKEFKGVVLPPLEAGQLVNNKMYQEQKDRVKNWALNSNKQPMEHLPPIEETQGGLTRLVQKSQDVKSRKNTDGPQQPLFFPRLTPEKYEEVQSQKQRKENSVNQNYNKCGPHNQKVREGQGSENTCDILLNPEEGCPAPLGLLTGKRGPGRQSSLAFLQNRLQPVPEESSDQSREVVRGVLPLELRDLNGQSVSCVILGPDGEIIQLSVFDNIQDSTQGQALEVLSAEGEKLPWVIMLQPEHQHAEGTQQTGAQLVNIQEEECNHKFPKLLDLLRSTETDPGSVMINADSDAAKDKELKESQKVGHTNQTKRSRTVKNPELDEDENTVELLSSRDGSGLRQESREDTRVKDKNLSSSVHLSQSQQQDKQRSEVDEASTKSTEAQFQNKIKNRKRIGKIKDTEEPPVFKEGKTKHVSPNSNQQNASLRGKEDEEMNDSRPISGQKPVDTDSANTSSATKRSKNKEAKTKASDVKKNDKRVNNSGHEEEEEASGERIKKKRRGKLKHKDVKSEKAHNPETEAIDSNQESEEEVHKKPTNSSSPKQKHDNKVDPTQDDSDTDHFPLKELTLNTDKHSRSMRSLRSGASGSGLKLSSSQRSVSSSYEGGTQSGSAAFLSMSRSRLSSCSTVMIPEEQLMLNPTNSEVAMTEQVERNQEEKAAAAQEAQRVESQRQEDERKRRKQEEEERRQQQREEVEQQMRNELQNERQRRAEELRLKKQAEEEERRSREEEEQRRERRLQEQREREIRRQQERRRQMELFQKKREEEEQRRKAELELLRLMEEKRIQEENIKLQEMDESERIEYLRQKQEEKDARKREEDERRRRAEEAALLSAEKAKIEEELLAREMILLHQRLSFKRGLMVEAEGLEKSQGISRPWTYSYFTLLQLLGLSATGEHHT